MKEYSISLIYAICTSLPFSFTGADASVTVVGSIDAASKPVSLKMAAGPYLLTRDLCYLESSLV